MQSNAQLLKKHGYSIVGRHSAVKLCHWARERLLRKRACYKAKFYGIASHRCVQMTPSVSSCQHSCLYCWRPIEHTPGMGEVEEADEPSYIALATIDAQRRLISGYGGEKRVSRREIEEAYSPRHVAISLAGEPTNYPYIDELIDEYHKLEMTTFLVTNGMNPQAIERASPTSLYLSLTSPNREVYRKLNRPKIRGGWERLQESMEVFSTKATRKVARLTLVRGYNLGLVEEFSRLIGRIQPDFVEPKGYVHVGYSRRRLKREHMPTYDEVESFSSRLAEATGYEVKDSSPESKVVLLRK